MTEAKTETPTGEDIIEPAVAPEAATPVVLPDPGSLAIAPDQTYWTDGQLAALRQMGVARAPRGDLLVFHHYAQVTGLDPFLRQLYLIARDQRERQPDGSWQKVEKWTIQTGIDGFRLIARRAVTAAGETLEYEDTLYCGNDGVWTDVWTHGTAPVAAKVVVLRNGLRFPAVALFREYGQTKQDGTPIAMWASMPANQLAKCAEALALRKAFPQDLGGLYTDDEMGQADRDRDESPSPSGGRRATDTGTSVREAMDRRRREQEAEAAAAAANESAAGDDVVDGDVMVDGRSALAQSLKAAFRDIGITDQAGRLLTLGEMVGRTIKGVNEVTETEAQAALATLAQRAAGEDETDAVAPPSDTTHSDAVVDSAEEHARIIAEELAEGFKTDG